MSSTLMHSDARQSWAKCTSALIRFGRCLETLEVLSRSCPRQDALNTTLCYFVSVLWFLPQIKITSTNYWILLKVIFNTH